MKTVLITGATGLVGSALAARALQRGMRCVALTRSASADVPVRSAVLSALRGDGVELSVAERLVQSSALVPLAVQWDDLARFSAQLSALVPRGSLEATFHCAANLTYGRKHLHAAYAQNVIRSMELYLRMHGHRELLSEGFRFHFVSTAYCVGMTGEPVAETLHHGLEEMPTVYHLTKNIAEKNLWLASLDDSRLPLTILRPSGIVGHSRTGWFGEHAAGMAQVCEVMAMMEQQGLAQVRLGVDMDTSLNLVPVDVLVDWMFQVHEASSETGAPSRDIVHLTPVTRQHAQAVMDAAGECFGARILGGTPSTPLEVKLDAAAGMAKLYWNHTWQFQRARLEALCGVSRERDPFDAVDAMARTARWWRMRRKPQKSVAPRRMPRASGGSDSMAPPPA